MWRLTTNLPKKGVFAARHYVGVRRQQQTNNNGGGGVRLRRCFTNCNTNNATTAAVMRSSSSSSIVGNSLPSLISPSTSSRQHQNHRGQIFRFFATDNDNDNEKADTNKTTWDLDNTDFDNFDDDDDDDDDEDDFQIGDIFTGSGGGDDADSSIHQTEEENEERERYRLAQEVINAELDARTGRPWQDPWHISEEQWMSTNTTQENLADWSPDFVSRVSLERIQILENGIPTLEEMSKLNNLPVGQPGLHPSEYTKKYASYRKSWYYESVSKTVQELASDRVTKILKAATAKSNLKDSNTASNNNDWYDKQESVDILFEEIQEEVLHHSSMDILSKHPDFQNWVGRSLEEFLTKSMKKQKKNSPATTTTQTEAKEEDEKEDVATAAAAAAKEGEGETAGKTVEEHLAAAIAENNEEDDDAVDIPVFMDCFDPIVDGGGNPDDDISTTAIVPKILHPLKVHKHGGVGKMVEEWELSAHTTTKRIMIRDTTKQIAHTLISDEGEGSSSSKRIYVHGKKGVGKSATLASIVASSRKSGYIVMYMPDGDRLSKNGFFVTPNTHRVGMYDLQDLSQEAIQQLLDSHEDDIEKLNLIVSSETLHKYFKDTQLKRLNEFCGNEDATNDENISLMDVMKYSKERKVHAPMCYSIMVHELMTQTSSDTKFLIVMDEFNCLYDHQGHYFHMSYDDSVRTSIPCNQINLFEPIMNFMNLSSTTNEDDDDDDKEGNATNVDDDCITASVIVGSTESHAIRREISDSLTSSATTNADANTATTSTTTCIEIPRFTSLEVDHILANYEATGVGKLRSDRGDTIMNLQEVEYLKMCSGSIGQKLLDVSIM